MFNILFVCTENTCRSPMCEYIFKHLLKSAKLTGANCESAGIYAVDGAKYADNVRVVLKELKIIPKKKSKALTLNLVNKADLIVPLTSGHKVEIVNKFNCLNKTQTFAELGGANVSDPYGLGVNEYRETARIIFDNCVKLINILLKEGIICEKKTSKK